MKIIHVIIGLESGGAEATLYKILTKNKKKISHMVISMTGPGFYGKKIESNGVIVKYLNMKSPISIFLGLFKLLTSSDGDSLAGSSIVADYSETNSYRI